MTEKNKFRQIHLCLILIFVCRAASYCQVSESQFDHLSIYNGLLSDHVTSVVQDEQGVMWFATTSGLNSFDGHQIKDYQELISRNVVFDREIRSVEIGPSGLIWFGTRTSGLGCLNRVTNDFRAFESIINEPQSLIGEHVIDILEDNDGNVWVATNKGLTKIFFKNGDLNTPIFRHYFIKSIVELIYQDNDGNIWVGVTGNGIHKYNTTDRDFDHVWPQKENQFERLVPHAMVQVGNSNEYWLGCWGDGLFKLTLDLDSNISEADPIQWEAKNTGQPIDTEIGSLLMDSDGILWIGSLGKGLFTLNDRKHEVFQFINNPNNPESLNGNTIFDLYQDTYGSIWIATIGSGIDRTNPLIGGFSNLRGSNNSLHLSEDDIISICEDSKNNLWVGTNTQGLNKINNFRSEKDEEIVHIRSSPNSNLSLASDIISSIYEDSRGSLWVGTLEGGLHRMIGVNNFERFNPENSNICDRRINAITEDMSGNIWVGSYGGLNKINLNDEGKVLKIETYQNNPEDTLSLSYNKVNCLTIDQKNNLWVGTSHGFNLLKHTDGSYSENFIKFFSLKNDSSSISSNSIDHILETEGGEIWIGTDFGLNKLIIENEKVSFQTFFKKDGLISNTIKAIVEDNEGNIWASANGGISKYSPATKNFQNFNSNNLRSTNFSVRCAYKTSNNEILFGGSKGLHVYNFPKGNKNAITPKPLITQLKIFDKVIQVGQTINERVLLNKNINYTDSILIFHDENFISLQFTGCDFLDPSLIQYKYKIEGLSDQWINNGNNNSVSISNISPGGYTFLVKRSNHMGIWSEETAKLHLTVQPPFWLTYKAYTVYILIILSIIIAYQRFKQGRQKIKHELSISKIQNEKEKELSNLKLRFFTNISHEFRTPLTLILGPIEQLINGNDRSNYKSSLQTIHSNSQRLLRLINQLMDFRKLESGNMELAVSEGDLVSHIQNIFESFSPLAKQGSIKYTFSNELDSQETWFDYDKIEKIIFNLLSNAFKFTPEKGVIEVLISPNKGTEQLTDVMNVVEISVTNTGRGIDKSSIHKIFERFQSSTSPRQIGGTGIGLSLTKSLVELHHGKIYVSSTPNKKTIFSICIPGGKASYNQQELSAQNEFEDNLYYGIKSPYQPSFHLSVNSDQHITNHNEARQHKILIVEDNPDIRKYLVSILAIDYNIMEANNGKEGCEAAKEHPNLIISDIMMPEMDGIAMCAELKTNIKTSHIPIILLTARNTVEGVVEGFDQGADDYIAKPFNDEILKSRIKNLISSREKLAESFRLNGVDIDQLDTLSTIDQDFLKNAISLVESNLNNPDLNSQYLMKELGMSRTLLFKKLKALTDTSATEFIRNIKLEKAAELLKLDFNLSISEIAHTTGFNDQKYFRKKFNEKFGSSPSQFRKELQS